MDVKGKRTELKNGISKTIKMDCIGTYSPYCLSLLVATFSLSHSHAPLFTTFPAVTPSDSVVRRSISQQKSGVSVTIDDPIHTTRQPSPPHGKVSNIIHVTNLVGL